MERSVGRELLGGGGEAIKLIIFKSSSHSELDHMPSPTGKGYGIRTVQG